MDLLLINIYSSLLSGLFMITIGFFVFFKNPKTKTNIIFLFFCLAVANWLLATFMMYRSDNDARRIFWDRIVYIGVVFIPILMYHFGLVFTGIEKKNKNKLYFGYFVALVFLVLSQTNYFVDDLYKYAWGVHTQARILHHLFLLFFFFYVILFIIEIYNFLKKKKEKLERRPVEYLFISFLIMNIGAYAFLPAYGININPLGAYGVEIIAVLILAFAILRYHLFEIRVILTEILVGVMGILLLIFPFLLPGGYRIFALLVFLLFCLFGYYLVKATHEESKRREEAEKIAIQERALREKSEKLAREFEKLARAKDQFLLSIQHHLRTPLTPIRGYAEMILEGTYSLAEIKKKILAIKKSADTLYNLMESLLDIQALRMGKEILNLEKCQLTDLIEEVIEELKPQAKEKGIPLYFEKDSLPEMKLDKKRIKEVIWNLIDNAIKYTNKGKVNIKVQNLKSKVLLMVSDTGIGMTEEEREYFLLGKLFERGVEAKKLFGPGRGVGLAISIEFVKAHGGKIWVESEGRGKGTTFYVELPIKKE